jgi:hypothetical protein
MARLEKQGDADGLRHQLTQQAEPLCSHLHGQGGDSSGVAARSIEAADEPQFDRRIGDQKVDRNGRCRRLGRHRCRGAGQRRDHRNALTHQVRRQFRQPVVLPSGPAKFDRDVLPLHKTGFRQAFAQSSHAFGVRLGRTGVQESDDRQLLRACRNWPRDPRAEQRNEVPPRHVEHALPPLCYWHVPTSGRATPP